jgi:hypothetical protein
VRSKSCRTFIVGGVFPVISDLLTALTVACSEHKDSRIEKY